MSARQAAEAMAAAAAQANAAKSAIVQHRSRSNRDWRSHINDAYDMSQMTAQAISLVVNLVDVMHAAHANTRAHYLNDPAPEGREWPQAVTETAQEAAQNLKRVQNQLAKLRIHQAYNTLTLLHATLQNAARNASRGAT